MISDFSLRGIVLAILLVTFAITTPTAHATPSWMTATGTVVHDGGFGGPTNTFGPAELPFDPNPPITVHSTIHQFPTGEFESTVELGGSRYFDLNKAVVVLANGSFISQIALGPPLSSPFGPAMVTVDVAALARVDHQSNWIGFYNFPVFGHLPEGGFFEIDMNMHFTEYVGLTDGSGLHIRDIVVDLPLSGHMLITAPGEFRRQFAGFIPLPDIFLTRSERSLQYGGFLQFDIHAVISILDPNELTSGSFETNFGFVDPDPVPEPSTFALAGLGLLGLGFVALRKKYRRA